MNRRRMIALSLAGGTAALAYAPRPAWARARRFGQDDAPEMKAAVAGGEEADDDDVVAPPPKYS